MNQILAILHSNKLPYFGNISQVEERCIGGQFAECHREEIK